MLIEESTLVMIVEDIQVESSVPRVSKGNRRLNKLALCSLHFNAGCNRCAPFEISFAESFF